MGVCLKALDDGRGGAFEHVIAQGIPDSAEGIDAFHVFLKEEGLVPYPGFPRIAGATLRYAGL